MLMHLIYSDFGFSPAKFAKCLTRTHSIFVQSTDINKLFRDKLAGDIPFYAVDQQSFKESLKDKNQCIIIELDKTENTHYYNKALTKEVKDHWSSNTSLSLNDFIQSMAHETLIVETIKQAYITCDEKAFPLHNLLLITRP